MVECKFKCRYYNNNSAMCKGETKLCATRRRLIYWFRRLEVVNNQIDAFKKKEKENHGLNVNDNQAYDTLEKTQRQFEGYIGNVGVRIE